MFQLVTGGSGSGKSAYAEELLFIFALSISVKAYFS